MPTGSKATGLMDTPQLQAGLQRLRYRTQRRSSHWGGEVKRFEVEEVKLGCTASCAVESWERRIEEVAGEHEVVMFMDGSKGEDGKVAGGWAKDTSQAGPWDGGRYLEKGATIWDGEAAGMAEALERGPQGMGVLILADSMIAIQAVKKAGRTGISKIPHQGGRTRGPH